MTVISIHALREEGDGVCRPRMPSRLNFYPRPPRGGRLAALSWSTPSWGFLSTPSARRATFAPAAMPSSLSLFLSTPSARRATLESVMLEQTDIDFYPRPPRGGRPAEMPPCVAVLGFLSTPSARRATEYHVGELHQFYISIHALREEGDPELITKQEDTDAISIHALREEGDLWLDGY